MKGGNLWRRRATSCRKTLRFCGCFWPQRCSRTTENTLVYSVYVWKQHILYIIVQYIIERLPSWLLRYPIQRQGGWVPFPLGEDMDRVSPRSGFSGCLGCKAHDASRSHEEILVKILQHGGYFGIVNHTYLGSRFSFTDISWIYLPPLILNRLNRTFTVCKMRNWCLLPSSPLRSMILMDIPGFVSQPWPTTVGYLSIR